MEGEDVVAMVRALLDIRANTERILGYLEDDDGEEEEA
jgi:hypothetical protein